MGHERILMPLVLCHVIRSQFPDVLSPFITGLANDYLDQSKEGDRG